MNQLILLRGYPGSGKTTVGKLLEKRGVGKFIDHNAILTFISTISGDDDGIYDDIANLEQAIARKLLTANKTVIVARGFSSLKSIEPYLQLAHTLNIQSKVIRLDVDYQVLAHRVTSAERKMDFNPTTDSESLKKWIQENPIIDFSEDVIIDNSRPIDEVVDKIAETI